MSTHPRGPRALVVGTALALVLAGGVAAHAAPGADDSPDLFHVQPSGSVTLAEALAEFDVVGIEGDQAVVLGDDATREALTAAGLDVVRTQSYADAVGVGSRSARLGAASTGSYPLPAALQGNEYPTFFGGYRTVAAHEQFLADVASAYPDLTELVDFGDSWERTQDASRGHDLLALRVTAGADSDGDWAEEGSGKPRFFLNAQAHAREIITSELAWRFVVDLVDGYGSDAEVTALLDSTEIWVVPHNNPDASTWVEEALERTATNAAGDATPASTSRAWQRKNANTTGYVPPSNPNAGWSGNHPGVDLNRNFGTDWGGASTSANPNAATYKGVAPFSEPEVADLADLLTTLFGSYEVGTTNPAPDDRQGVYVNLHSHSNYVIYPYAYDAQANVPNLEPIRALGFRQSHFNGYNTGKAGEILYNNAGNDIDWIYDQLGIPAYTWEIGNAATGGFFPAFSRAETFWDLNAPALFYAARAAADPYRSPLGPSVTDVAVSWQGGGSVSVAGTADDGTLGTHPGAAGRRPAVHAVTDVEVAVGGDPAAAAAQALTLTSEGSSVTFDGTLAPTGDAHERQIVHVRARNAAGHWGPWTARWLQPLAAGPGEGHQLVVAEVQAGALALEVPAGATALLSQVTLSGEDQLAEGSLERVRVLDGRGTSGGWVLSGQVSDFGGSRGGVILADNLGWSPSAEVLGESLGLQVPEGSSSEVVPGSPVAPGTPAGLSVPQSLATSPAGRSAGVFGVGGDLQLGVPASSVAGVFSGVLTLTLI